MASALGIGDVLGRKPSQLSGGQRQRVAMGRAIVRRPGLFLMDEPLSNLDSGLRAELRAEITGLTRELGVTTMYVTHDQAEALTMADRVAIMRKGVLQDVGTPTEVYGRPATLYVAAFLGSPRMNLLEASVYVHLDQYIALKFGEQSLYLPWDDVRARAVSRYHGERIVVGLRAEALTPVAPEVQGDVLQRPDPLSRAPRARVAGLPGHRRDRDRRRRDGRAVSATGENGSALRKFGGALQKLNGRERGRPRTSNGDRRAQRAERPGPAPPSSGRAGRAPGALPGHLARAPARRGSADGHAALLRRARRPDRRRLARDDRVRSPPPVDGMG